LNKHAAFSYTSQCLGRSHKVVTVIEHDNFMMLSPWHCDCESWPGSFVQRGTGPGSQSAWATDPHTNSYSKITIAIHHYSVRKL